MKGYALEIRMIRWECKCKRHSPSGMCFIPGSKMERVEQYHYNGSFFYGLKTHREREQKLDEVMLLVKK